MKYINQINFVLAALGVVIVGYALSQTLLAPSARADLDLDRTRQMEPLVVDRPGATEAPAALLGSTTTARSAVREATPAARQERPVASSGIVGRSAPPSAPAPSPANRRAIQNQAPAMPTWLGDPEERSESRGSGVVMPSAPMPGGGQPARNNVSRPTGSLVRPPAGAEGVKRDGSTDPPSPPMRSSSPQTTPRRP